MAWKQLALAAALLGIAIPSEAFDTPFDNRTDTQAVMVYYAFPLDARSKKDRIPWMGLQIQGRHYDQSFSVDTRMFNFDGGSAYTSLVVAGAVALGAAVMVGQRGKSSQQEVQQQQQANQQAQQAKEQQQPPCPQNCP